MELHDYPRKPEIEYKDPSTGTYHYTIISEGYYPSPPVLVRTQRKKKYKTRNITCTINYIHQCIDDKMQLKPCFKIEYNNGHQTIESWRSATHAANLFVQMYNPNGKSTLSGTIVFGLQLKCVEQARDSHRQSNALRPLETLSNSAKRSRIKQIGEKMRDYINHETTHLHHKDKLQIKSLVLSVDDQNWIVNYSKDMTFEKIKSQACVCVMDKLDCEYIISNKKLNLDKIMQDIIPLYIIDININSSTIFATNNEEIHIDNEEIIYGVTESVEKASYRSIKDILKYIIPFYIEENILDPSNPLIMLRILGM
ncbi:15717_t:CDS:2 [Cetraspora pellucida]|uniref:15717_t:CDS:1 n=1 Tax=Cetraspora pellucida TaxID=1433469 RepID=A0A9N9FA73_9GLOM|nr:15717_t:CDS:2 [Cetraspora pellucida]